MKYNEFLEDFKIIEAMDTMYQEKFFALVNHYATVLDKGNAINDKLYTLHNFSNHCINIYKILDNYILSEAAFLKDGLTKEELFVLNISVLFHDISMAKLIHFDRNTHSNESALFIMKEYENDSSPINMHISRQQRDAIMIIIKSHSDTKINGNKENALDDPKLTNEMPGYSKPIRAKLLAGLLRLADELDVTSSRLGNDLSYYKQLNENDKEESESMEHWNRLMCFNDIIIDPNNVSIIKLVTDDDYIESEMSNILQIRKRIHKVVTKIKCECSNVIKKTILIDNKSARYVLVRNVEVSSNIKEILDEQNGKVEKEKRYHLRIVSFSETAHSEGDLELNLTNYFENRFIKNSYTWKMIISTIKEYINKNMKQENQYIISFATHYAVAFMAGRIMNSKSGLETTLIQKTLHGMRIWNIDERTTKEYEELTLKMKEIDDTRIDIGIVISLTKDIEGSVKKYIDKKSILLKEISFFSLREPSNEAIVDANHAWRISKQISRWIDKCSHKDKNGRVHLFIACPVTIMFYLGKLSLAFGKGIIYDYNYEKKEDKEVDYYPTLDFYESDWL